MDAVDYRRRCEAVAAAFAVAFPEYVARRLLPLVTDPESLRSEIAAAAEMLERQLADWASRNAHDQRTSPLELVREALAGPTAAAVEAGARPVVRDAIEAAALPGDLLGIAPATSQDLGEEAWRAHVAWGLARAEAIAGMVPRPASQPAGARVALVGSDLMDRSKIEAAAGAAGYELAVWRNPAAIDTGLEQGSPQLAFVDLAHAAAHDAIRSLVAAGVRTIAYGPHVDDHALAAAGALGASDVLPRSKFFRRLPELFPTPL